MPRTTKRSIKRPVARKHRSRPCPKISRSRLRVLRENLDETRTSLTETLRFYWAIPETDVRSAIADTNKVISQAVNMLAKAA